MFDGDKKWFGRCVMAMAVCLTLAGCSDDSASVDKKPTAGCEGGCGETQTCINNACVENSLICGENICTVEQTCLNAECVNNADLCGGKLCVGGESCFNGGCVDSSKVCGEGVCEDAEVCFEARCVSRDELCGGIVVCDLSTEECVDNNHCEPIDLCRNVTCTQDGQKCDKGECRDRRPCEDIQCADGKTCAVTVMNPLGECIDEACAVDSADTDYKVEMRCGENQMCVAGECLDDGCVVNGEPMQCKEGWECVKGACEETACIGKVCDTGRTCTGGSCIDDECLPLDEHVCDAGFTCSKGDCIYDACVGKEACKQGKVCVEDGTCQFTEAPALKFSENEDMTTDESGKTTSLQLSLNNEPAAEATFTCEVLPAEAADEAGVSCEDITFSAQNWDQAQIVNITGVADNVVDGDQVYTVKLTSHSEDPEFDGLTVESASLTNVDVDKAGLSAMDATGLMTDESGAMAEFTIKLDSRPAAPVTIKVSSSDATEGVVTSVGGVDGDTVTIQPDDWNKPVSIVLTGVDDNKHDPGAFFQVNFELSSDDPNYNNLSVDAVSVTNGDNDTPGLNLSSQTLTTDEKPSSDTFSFALATAPSDDVKVVLSVVKNADEVTLDKTEFVIAKKDWNVKNTVVVTGVVDNIIDPDEPFEILITVSSAGDQNYNFTQVITGTNKNVDIAGFVLPATASTSVTEAGASVAFEVHLTSKPTGNVVVEAVTNDGTETKVTSSALTFTPDNWNVSQKVTVVGVDDNYVDGTQTSIISLKIPNTDDTNFSDISVEAWKVSTEDDDVAGLVVSKSDIAINENGGSDTFTVKLAAQPMSSEVNVELASSNTAAATISPAKLVFDPSHWNKPQTVTVVGVDNKVAELGGKRDAVVNVKSASSEAIFNGLSNAVKVVVNDDETPVVDLSISSPLLTTTVKSVDLSVSLSVQPASDVVVKLVPSSPVFALSNTTLTFTKSNWNTAQTVKVNANAASASSAWTYGTIKGTASSSNTYNGLSDSVDVTYKAVETISGHTAATGAVTNCSTSVTLLPGKYKLQVWGASGGDGVNNSQTIGSHGGLGGYAEGVLTLTEKTTVYLHYGTVGYAGIYDKLSSNAVGGGCNGGGGGGQYASTVGTFGFGGGGASDIRVGEDSLYARVIVAGGGGGADNSGGTVGGSDDGSGGYGGGASGGYGKLNGVDYTAPGNQNSGYAFGAGEPVAYNYDLGGGGGGWYGGKAPIAGNNYGGGGGSGFVLTSAATTPSGYKLGSKYYLTSAKTVAGNATFPAVTSGDETGHKGNGYVKITLLE